MHLQIEAESVRNGNRSLDNLQKKEISPGYERP